MNKNRTRVFINDGAMKGGLNTEDGKKRGRGTGRRFQVKNLRKNLGLKRVRRVNGRKHEGLIHALRKNLCRHDGMVQRGLDGTLAGLPLGATGVVFRHAAGRPHRGHRR